MLFIFKLNVLASFLPHVLNIIKFLFLFLKFELSFTFFTFTFTST
ncbi:conserved hypothetical protein [Orientia tsutsugamushi str. Boryong]|uniref:Uncharacterized protein n=1 Tax=Orientia tsutsugamushi (strain Boryong) TaxID=357244 RepID=A5CFM1_ORITB|nr:conserved hypothetical protein [Orientia tsutsugamushi str. Boryong]